MCGSTASDFRGWPPEHDLWVPRQRIATSAPDALRLWERRGNRQ